MSIRKIQETRKRKEFQTKLLEEGVEPNNYELNRCLTSFFSRHEKGLPYFSPVKQVKYEPSDMEGYNHTYQTLEEDLHILYQASVDANNQSVAIQENYEFELNRLRFELNKLTLRTKNIQEIMQKKLSNQNIVQCFDTMYDIELYGNANRNIPETTAFVDLLQKTISLGTVKAAQSKLNLSSARVSMETTLTAYETNGELSYLTNDTKDELFVITGTSPSEGKETVTIKVQLPSLLSVNTVLFDFVSTKENAISLAVSDDGSNFIPVSTISSNRLVSWNFKTKTVQYLKFTITKEEADGMDGVNFNYYFLLKNISLVNEMFESKAIYVSKPFEMDGYISKLRLDATDMVYHNTRIDYFLGFDNEVDKVGWTKLENHKEEDLFLFERKVRMLNQDTAGFGEQDASTGLYKVMDLEEGVDRANIRLTPGYQTWSVRSYTPMDAVTNKDLTIHSLDYNSFVETATGALDFMDCDTYDQYQIQSNTLYVFTIYVDIAERKDVLNKVFSLYDAVGVELTGCHRLFVNGLEMSSAAKNKYSFLLRQGVNKIQIAIYYPGSELLSASIYHNINFKELTDGCYGFVPMKFINSSSLRSITDKEYQYYTLLNDGIYVKNDPRNTLVEHGAQNKNYANGFFLSYQRIKTSMLPYVKDQQMKFRIMVILSSTNASVTPKLMNYRITGR